MPRIISSLLIFFLLGCQNIDLKQTGLITDQAMVVTAHPLASEVGISILKQGGNAVDAAIAVQFALAVVYPDAGNIGGGGFLVIRQNNGLTDALDYREEAPAAAHKDMYLDQEGNVKEQLSIMGHLASGTPGTVDGMVKAHEKYGRMSWKKLVQPAVVLAEKGFPLTKKEARKLNDERDNFIKYNIELPEFILKDRWKEGDTLRLQELAKTLGRIRDLGRAGFYEGTTAELIENEMKKGGGIISKQDLSSYHSVWRKPVRGNALGFEIISMPPPSSGGIALLQLLKITEDYPVKDWGYHSVEKAHLMIEAERRVYADRAQYLGDPDFYDVPEVELLDPDYLKKRMENFSLKSASSSDAISAGAPLAYEGPNTTHYSIIDQEGNAVSVTTTLNTSFGSKVFVTGAGFLLNNQMDDFSVKPGHPNTYGLIGGEANAIAPNKRMLSSMTPAILEKDGKLAMVIGSMGGSTIITTVYQIILNVIVHDFSMQGAVNAGRFHHQWLPDWVVSEVGALGFGRSIKLWFKGHKIAPALDGIGRAAGIKVLPDGRLEGGADPRGDDASAGF